MFGVALFLFIVVAVIVIVHYIALAIFLTGIRRKTWAVPSEPFTPKTAVMLALRGADPFLHRCIEGLLRQDYPTDQYTVFLIVDHESDPALPVVTEVVNRLNAANVGIIVVHEHLTTCSLKCNSLVYAVERLDPTYEAVAILDADTRPHPSWLRELVEPLSDSRYAAASGHRWYLPPKTDVGSLVRYLWNAAAVVQLYLYKMAWGGALVLRRNVFHEGRLLETWKKSFSDDMSVATTVRAVNGQTAFVPSLFMTNRETCGLHSFHRWVKRQLLCAKLHHPAWHAIATQGLLITAPLLAVIVLFFASLFFGQWGAAVLCLCSFALYWGGVCGTLPLMERGIRRKLRERNEPLERFSIRQTIKIFCMIPLTQAVYTSALIGVYFLKTVEWRGIWYEIGRDKTVKLVEYIPYSEVENNPSPSEHESILS